MRPVLASTLLIGALLASPAALGNGWEHLAIPLPVLLRALASDSPEFRARAAISLGVKRDERAVPGLLAALRDEDFAEVRSAIYKALGQIGDARAAELLSDVLQHEERPELRADAALALGELGHLPTLTTLLTALRDERDIRVRSALVDSFGRFGDARAVTALTTLYRSEKNQSLRQRAIRSLGLTRHRDAAPVLIEALRDARGIDERTMVVSALGLIGSPTALGPLESLLEGTTNVELRARIAVALGSIHDGSGGPSLIALLDDSSSEVRYFALSGLQDLADAVAAPAVQKLYLRVARELDEPPREGTIADPTSAVGSLSVMQAALRALVELDPSVGLDAFLDGATPRDFARDSAAGLKLASEAYELRRLAIVGLGYNATEPAILTLVSDAVLRDPDPRIRATGVRAIGTANAPGGVDVIRSRMGDEDAEVRWTAAMVLGRLGDPRAIGLVETLLGDPHAEVRRRAVLAAGYLEAETLRSRLAAMSEGDASAKVRIAAEEALAMMPEPE